MKTDCPSQETLAAFAAGTLEVTTADGVISHLESCTKCSAFVDGASRFEAPLQGVNDLDPSNTDTLVPEIGLSVGDQIGPYELMEQLGSGGMGVVYVAIQREPIRRKVALKVIKPGTDTREVIARFEAERQTLAMMDHPNIAAVLDAGATKAGLPYFVMELVRGKPITEFCDEKTLNSEQRLELFTDVCRAVHHAHQKGIIHRDIKPQNVLVTVRDNKPVPKVIDFGVAKALRQDVAQTAVYTRFSQLLGTPLYMSPEQADLNSADIDTRSDIYSLGVLLYELLTGQTPIDRDRVKEAAYDELRRLIREEDPPKPSTRISSLGETGTDIAAKRATGLTELSRQIRGDLDWVVMRALEKDRTRRYETAIGFAEDIQRFLQHEPVEAGPPGSIYRLRKFVRRNRVWVITGSIVVTALVVGIVMTSLAMFRAIDMQEKADIAAADAKKEATTSREAVQRMLTAVGDKRLRDIPLMDGLRRELLEEALEFNKRFLADSQSREDRMEAGRAHVRAASIYEMLEQSENAETSHQEARKLFEQLRRAEPNNSDAAYWLAEVDRRIAAAYFADDNFVKAEPALRRCAKQFDLVENGKTSIRSALGKAVSLRMLGVLLHSSGKKADAEGALNDSLRTIEAIGSLDDTTRFEKTATVTELGNLYANSQRLDEALTSFKAAVKSYAALTVLRPRDRSFREALANSRDRLGGHYRWLGEHESARTTFEEATADFGRLATDFPQIPEYRLDVARSRNALAISTAQSGADPVGALTEFQTAAEELRLLTADFPHVVSYQHEYALGLRLVATHLANMYRWSEAETPLTRALEIQKRLSARSPEVTRYRIDVAELEFRLARARHRGSPGHPDCVPGAERAISICKPLADNLADETRARHALAKYYRFRSELHEHVEEFSDATKRLLDAIESSEHSSPIPPRNGHDISQSRYMI